MQIIVDKNNNTLYNFIKLKNYFLPFSNYPQY